MTAGPASVRSRRAAPETGKREAILEAALDLFAERGFHGTAVPLVAEKAGVGAGTLYRYFESKEALVNALYQQCKREMGEALLHEFPIELAPRKQFHVLFRRLGDFAKKSPRALAFLELHHHAPYLDDASRSLDAVVLDPIRSFVASAQRQRLVRPMKPDLAIAIVFGAFVGTLKECEKGTLKLDDDLLADLEEAAWRAVAR